MIRNKIAEIMLSVKYPHFLKEYSEYLKNPYKEINYLENLQNKRLKEMIEYSYNFVPYYNELFKSLHFTPNDINTQDDLQKLPILTKNEIKNNIEKFYSHSPRKYVVTTTGGSTGIPLRYLLDRESSRQSRVIVERNWNYSGYKIGDAIVTIGGGSLVPKNNIKNEIQKFFLNSNSFSSVGIDEAGLYNIYNYINRRRIKYIYGYASALSIFSEFIEASRLKFNTPIKAVFSTSECLMPSQRKLIKRALNTNVFDAYGLYDGGVSACECEMHQGLHIDYECSIMKIMDENGNFVKNGTGKIIATSLYNFAMPFINYDTGDYGEITEEKCQCKRNTARLLSIQGRTTDYLKIGDQYIGSPALTIIMGKLDILNYQIIQDSDDHIIFKIVMNNYDNRDKQKECTDIILKTMTYKIPRARCDFEFYEKTSDLNIKNKNKFIYRII